MMETDYPRQQPGASRKPAVPNGGLCAMRGAMRAGAPVLQPLPRALEACVSSLILISLPNGGNQRLATKGLSISPDFIASPLHCFVRRCITPRAVPKQFRSTLTPRKRLSKAQRSEQASNRRGHGRGLSADTPVRQHRAHQAIPHPLAQKDTRIVVSFCSCRLGEQLLAGLLAARNAFGVRLIPMGCPDNAGDMPHNTAKASNAIDRRSLVMATLWAMVSAAGAAVNCHVRRPFVLRFVRPFVRRSEQEGPPPGTKSAAT